MNSSQFKGSLLAASEWTQYSIYEEAHKEDLCLSRGRPQSWDPGTHLAKTKHCILQECQQETLRGLLHLKHVVLISGFGDSFMIVLWEYVILLGASVLTPLKVVFNAAISAIQCGIRGGKHKFWKPTQGTSQLFNYYFEWEVTHFVVKYWSLNHNVKARTFSISF